MFVELHIIQNFPPSNLNRDDLGQPKDAVYGRSGHGWRLSQTISPSVPVVGPAS